jgi:hypothetical protein
VWSKPAVVRTGDSAVACGLSGEHNWGNYTSMTPRGDRETKPSVRAAFCPRGALREDSGKGL